MAVLDLHNVDKAIYNALKENAGVVAIFGATPRIRFSTEPETTFPWVRVDGIPIDPWTRTMKPEGLDWIRRRRLQFNVFSQSTSLDEAAAGKRALELVLEQIPSDANATVTGGVIKTAIQGIENVDFDSETGTAVAITEWTFSFEPT